MYIHIYIYIYINLSYLFTRKLVDINGLVLLNGFKVRNL